jgi:lipoprotein-anchoring transpeptidase ErfK/SrfK
LSGGAEQRPRRRRPGGVAGALALAALLAGCSATVGGEQPGTVAAPPSVATTVTVPPTTLEVGPVSLGDAPHAAWAQGEVDLFEEPSAATHASDYPARNPWGDPSVFLVRQAYRDDQGELWLRILLPRRPNGASAWARAEDLVLTPLRHSVEVDLSERRLRLMRDGKVSRSYNVAIGASETPTPIGEFYVTAKLRPPTISEVYGDWALGLSGFSEVLDQFGTGDGQIALHGTTGTWAIGQAVSNGCIRLANPDIADLAKVLPLGSPVRIQA